VDQNTEKIYNERFSFDLHSKNLVAILAIAVSILSTFMEILDTISHISRPRKASFCKFLESISIIP